MSGIYVNGLRIYYEAGKVLTRTDCTVLPSHALALLGFKPFGVRRDK